jgi:ATP-binding cassette subfamily A (ABC1) protein 3
LIFLAVSGPLYLILLYLFEVPIKRFFRRRQQNVQLPHYKYEHPIDEDVRKEEERILHKGSGNLAVCASTLSKAYPPKSKGFPPFLAAHKISFGVNNGEVFALLGVNGAGKTTTFKMLTNDIQPSRGRVFICGDDIAGNRNLRHALGYCPQTNVLFDYLTVQEHFDLYSIIRGIPVYRRRELVDDLCDSLGIRKYLQLYASKLSGGTKRKLSVALAILGHPPVVLLDEPSTGIDPQARRQMWSIIGNVARKWNKCAVILTTHSMEEAEALSTRLAIMVNGTLRCIGPAQYIKNKFALGYCVEIKFIYPTNDQVIEFAQKLSISTNLDDNINNEGFQRMLHSIKLTTFAQKINPKGEYVDLYWMITSVKGVPLKTGLKYAIIEQSRQQLLEYLNSSCGDTNTEFVATGHYKYRIRHCKVSVGKLFGMIEMMVSLLLIA